MDYRVTGKKALISGADSGIGLATAKLLAGEGVQLAVTDVDQDRLDEAWSDQPGVVAVAADLTEPEAVERLHQRVSAELGPIDILVQSAGITGAQGLFHEIDDDGWRQTIEVDLLAPIRLVRTFLADLRTGGWGRLVLLASEDAVQPYDDELPYCAAKAGILSFAKGLSRSYASEGLLVNTVSPAFIATPMTDRMMQKRAADKGTGVDEAIQSFLAEERPYMELGRRGTVDEVAAVIAFLCSDLASFVNGSNYRVDAGSVATI